MPQNHDVIAHGAKACTRNLGRFVSRSEVRDITRRGIDRATGAGLDLATWRLTMDKRRTAQDPPRVRLPELRLDTRALLAWAERAFRAPGMGAVARAPSPMSVHAAGLVEAWVRELGGPRQVTAQRVALLRMASYMVARADASGMAMQDGVLVEPRLLLEPVRHGAALLERAGLDRAARDVNAIRTSATPASGVAGWRGGRS